MKGGSRGLVWFSLVVSLAACGRDKGAPADAGMAPDGGSDVGPDLRSDVGDVGDVTDVIADLGSTDACSADCAPPVDADVDSATDRAADAPAPDGVADRTSTDGPPDGPGSDAAPSCPGTTIRCGADCIDPSSDVKHCGATAGCGTSGGSAGVACTSARTCSTLVVQTRNFATGGSPTGVVVADLNADGRADLAVANGGGASVLLGRGDGTFQDAQLFAADVGAQSIAAGDVNRDGKLDLVLANHGAGTVSALLGNGDGTFQAHRDFAAGVGPYVVALADVNADGKLDIAVACGGAQSTYVLLGQGDGTFTFDVQIPFTQPEPQVDFAGVAAADVNKDGKVDLVMSNNKIVNVVIGNSDGSFQAPQAIDTNSGNAIAIGDVDGDGQVEILATALLGAFLAKRNASGVFMRGVSFNLGDTTNSLAFADVNGDGKLDIAATNIYSTVISLGNGDGTFKRVQILGYGNLAGSIGVHDFDGNGQLDFVFTDSGGARVQVILSSTGPLACR